MPLKHSPPRTPSQCYVCCLVCGLQWLTNWYLLLLRFPPRIPNVHSRRRDLPRARSSGSSEIYNYRSTVHAQKGCRVRPSISIFGEVPRGSPYLVRSSLSGIFSRILFEPRSVASLRGWGRRTRRSRSTTYDEKLTTGRPKEQPD